MLTPLVSRFAEPERVPTYPQSTRFSQLSLTNHPQKRTPTAPAPSPPPLNIQKQHSSARHSPSQHYDKPAPPLPRDDRDYRPSGGSGSGSSSRPVPSPRDERFHPSNSGPVSQPTGNFTYGQSPPQDRRLDNARDGRDDRRDRDGRDTRGYRGPASPALTGEDPNLLPLFRAVDKDGTNLTTLQCHPG